ncbi:hypothetical protein VDG1235_1520 [Verrucomicrobiia bacterium DG1235]|nr:hypothetical protein VDG1235_1520 [Verrucomicrobiae bacterium DG1235]
MICVARILSFLFLLPYFAFSETIVYFGTYTGKGSEGIYQAFLDTDTGGLSEARLAFEVNSPPFLVIHPSGRRLYSISEVEDGSGNKSGGVSAFDILADGSLRLINQQPSVGAGPCHVSLDKTGSVLLLANYSDGRVGSYPILEDGSIGAAVSTFQHVGSSVNESRQESAHAHSINVDPSNKRAYAADLGTDELRIYELDAENGAMEEHGFSRIAMPAGGGPRHMTFHPSGEFAYTNLELTSQAVAMSHDEGTGELKILQTLSTLPEEGVSGRNSTAEILAHPSGKFLYVSNRGHDSIAIFRIDQDSGMLTYSGNESTKGKTPRNFGIDPSGRFLVVANQNSNDVFSFRIDQQTGLLDWTGSRIEVPTAVCVRFLER